MSEKNRSFTGIPNTDGWTVRTPLVAARATPEEYPLEEIAPLPTDPTLEGDFALADPDAVPGDGFPVHSRLLPEGAAWENNGKVVVVLVPGQKP